MMDVTMQDATRKKATAASFGPKPVILQHRYNNINLIRALLHNVF
jgi:hypothetical protein